jgi:hypothetical protein
MDEGKELTPWPTELQPGHWHRRRLDVTFWL